MLRKFTHILHHHFSHDSAWRHTGVYAALLSGVLFASAWWPADPGYWIALMEHPSVLRFSTGALQFAWWMLVLCALIGIQRQSWVDRIGAAVALYRAQVEFGWIFVSAPDRSLLEAAYEGIFHLIVVMPFESAVQAANEVSGVAAAFVALYLATVWVVVRFAATWAGPRLTRTLRRRGLASHA